MVGQLIRSEPEDSGVETSPGSEEPLLWVAQSAAGCVAPASLWVHPCHLSARCWFKESFRLGSLSATPTLMVRQSWSPAKFDVRRTVGRPDIEQPHMPHFCRAEASG